ncbi:translation initiation factor eIF-2B epsilon subunit, GEF, partial [Elasticomyces elasticus]
MPPKQTKAAAPRKAGEDTKEDPLQAVVLLDSFEDTFRPFTTSRPRCLLPICNTPLIEYTLDYLASCGAQDVYLYANNQIEQVESYINASRWVTSSSPFRKCTLLRCIATGVGDLMRDLDSQQIMQGDFLCVSGDIVSDFPIQKALRAHKARRAKDKNAIMTMILRDRSGSEIRHQDQSVSTFVIDPTKDRCLQYEELSATDSFGSHLDPEMLRYPELDIRQDLVDCRIDICTPDVLSLWSDNFDNQRPRKDFLFGVLKDYELNGKTIHTYIVDDYYANRVSDLSAYIVISRDLQSGSAGSLMLSSNSSGSRLAQLRNNVLKGEDVILQRPVRLESNSLIGSATSVGAHSTISNSHIGQRCQIGKNTTLKSAYLWDDVTVGSNVTIDTVIIGSEAFIGDNSTIGEGCLLDFSSRIPANTHVPAGSIVTKSTTFADGVKDKKTDNYFDNATDDDTAEATGVWARSIYAKPEFNDSISSLASDESEIS